MGKSKRRNRGEKSIYQWSWGAFGFRWIWGLFFGVHWPLYYKIGYILLMMLVLPLCLKENSPTPAFFTFAALFTGIDIMISIYLGIVGRRQAWWSLRKQWSSREELLRKERRWQWAFFIALILLLILTLITIGQFLMDFVQSGSLPSDIRTLPK